MSKPKYGRVDANHVAIIKYLRAHGIFVTDFSQAGKVPDALVYYNGQSRWLEIKVPTRKASFKRVQLDYVSTTPMDVAFITDEVTALDYAKHGTGALTRKQKDNLAGMLHREPGKVAFTVGQVERAIGEANG